MTTLLTIRILILLAQITTIIIALAVIPPLVKEHKNLKQRKHRKVQK